jgi:CBS domain-containing protein
MTTRDVARNDERDEVMRAIGGHASVRLFTGDMVATVASDATLREVATELVGGEVGLLVVGSVDQVEGVVSERDVVRAVASGKRPEATLVTDVASTRLVWCDSTATVDEVGELMMEQYVRHVLVEDGGQLVGVVSARDLLGAYVVTPE